MSALEHVIPEGYKQTEVGFIPINWSLTKLEHLTSLIIDGTHHTPTYTSFGVPFLRVTDIQGPLDDNKFKYVSEREHKVLIKRCKPELGDLLLSKNGTIGIPKVVDWEWEFSVFVSLALIKPIKKLLKSSYLEQYFKSDFLKLQLSQRAKQGTVTNLHLEEIRELLIPVPKAFEEQTAIANALSDVDVLLTELEKLIAKKQAIKTATMQQLLTGKTRLPQFATYTQGEKQGQPKGTKPSELGEIPEDWDVVKLDSLADVIDPHPSHRAPPESPSGLPFLGIGDFDKHGNVIKSSFRTVGNYVYDEHRARYKLEEGLLGLGRVASIGKVVRLKSDIGNYTISPTLGVLKPQKIDLDYLFYFLESDLTKNQFMKIMSGSTRSSVGMIVLRELNILALPNEEAKCIGKVLSDMDNEIQTLEQRLAKTRQIKQGMMQQLLTGRTRLPFKKLETEQDGGS